MLEWYFPETNIPSDFYAIMRFNSGATATTVLIDEDCVLTGDDCKGGIFTPVANKKYSVFVWYDGTKQGVVRGIPTDGKWEDGTITIGSSTATSPAELKKVVYCPSASVPATPEVGVEYALTDLIGEEDLNSALQTKINSFATKTEVSAVSTVANNALPKSGGSVAGNLAINGTLTVGSTNISTSATPAQGKIPLYGPDGVLKVANGVENEDAVTVFQLSENYTELNGKINDKRDLLTQHGNEGSVYAVKDTDIQTYFDVSTSPEKGKIPLYGEGGILTVSDGQSGTDAVNMQQFNEGIYQLEQKIQSGSASNKRDLITTVPRGQTYLYSAKGTGDLLNPAEQSSVQASQDSINEGFIPIRKANGQIQAPNQDLVPPNLDDFISRRYGVNHFILASVINNFCKHTAGSYGVSMTRATSPSDTGTDKIRDQSIYIVQAYKQDGNLTDFTINASKNVTAKMALIFCDTGDFTLGFAFTGSALITDVAKSVSRIQSIVPSSGARIAYYRVALDN